MAVNIGYEVPFNPQTGVTQQILAALQLANEHHIQNQTLALQQQQSPSLIAQRTGEAQASTAQAQATQAGTQAGLPQAQAAAEQARTNYTNLQAQVLQQSNPLQQEVIRSQARSANAEASLDEAKVGLLQNPGDFGAAVDSAIPKDKYPELNNRTKTLINATKPMMAFDPEAPTRILGQGISEIDTIERETNPQVIAARVQQSVDTQRQLYGGGAVSGVAPHLIVPATEAATKAGTGYGEANQTNQDFKSLIDLSKQGNKVAYAYDPVAGVLSFNTASGVKRVNMSEIGQYGGAGSALDRIKGWLGKQTSGQSIDKSVLDDMASVQSAVAKGAQDKYANDIKVINQNYGAKFQPLDFGSGSGSTAQAPAKQSTQGGWGAQFGGVPLPAPAQ